MEGGAELGGRRGRRNTEKKAEKKPKKCTGFSEGSRSWVLTLTQDLDPPWPEPISKSARLTSGRESMTKNTVLFGREEKRGKRKKKREEKEGERKGSEKKKKKRRGEGKKREKTFIYALIPERSTRYSEILRDGGSTELYRHILVFWKKCNIFAFVPSYIGI